MHPPRDYLLRFRPLPGDVPVHLRLRWFLKVGLRRFGLRCLEMSELDPADTVRRVVRRKAV